MKSMNEELHPQLDDRADLDDAARVAQACARECEQRLNGEAIPSRDCADIYPDFKDAVERMTGGTNTVLLDDEGMPSVMVRIGRMTLSSLISGASEAAHPAFFMGDAALDCIYISKYQNIVRNGRSYSLPMQDPHTLITFDEASGYCRSKGPGWGLTPFSLRAAIALWSKKNGTLPHGNSDSGRDYFFGNEAGIPTSDGRVATGSGPDTWAHNGRPDGIFDLSGNVNEWDAGLRLQDGEIQIIPGADCLLPSADLSPESPQWRAILPDGSLAAPGTQGTLCYGGEDGCILLTASPAGGDRGTFNCAFRDIRANKGLVVPEIAKALMLFPEAPDEDYGSGWRWIKNEGENLPFCGGAHKVTDHAGIFFVGMTYPRTHRYELSGFRSAYVSPVSHVRT
jgi:hypothetical protein